MSVLSTRRNLKNYLQAGGSILPMTNRAAETLRELPMPAVAYGLVTFGILSLFLYLALRLDRD